MEGGVEWGSEGELAILAGQNRKKFALALTILNKSRSNRILVSVLVDKSSKLIKYEATVPINFAISSHPSTEKKQKSLSWWRCKLGIQRNTKIFAYRKEPTHYYFFSKDAFCLYSIKYFSIRHEKRLTELCQWLKQQSKG